MIPHPRRMDHLPLYLLLAILLSGCARLITPDVSKGLSGIREGQYRLDPNHSTLLFKIDHLGLSKFVGRFNRLEASLDFNPARMEEAKLEALVDIASLDVNNPDFAQTLTGRNWLHSAKFPQASFKTVGVELLGAGSANFSGELTLLGITAPLVLRVVFNGGADNILTGRYTLGFEAHGSFRRSDFGMDSYIPAIGDEVILEIHAEFQRR